MEAPKYVARYQRFRRNRKIRSGIAQCHVFRAKTLNSWCAEIVIGIRIARKRRISGALRLPRARGFSIRLRAMPTPSALREGTALSTLRNW
jgi:hypothetical protein